MLWLLIIPVIPYFLILAYIFRGHFRNKFLKGEVIDRVKVSVVIACLNEEEYLPSLLNDLAAQDYPADLFEVIFVDDHSVDNTGSVASSFCNRGRFRVLRNSGTGKKSALRTGIMASDGDLILTTDADCRVSCRWVSAVASFYSSNRPDLLIGPVHLSEERGLFHRFQQLEFFSLQGITAATAGLSDPVMCNGANLAFTRDIYEKHSGNLHDEIASGDDIFLLQSIKSENSKILWLGDRDAVVKTRAAGSFRQFLDQRARWVSKSGAYEDKFMRLLALITLIANIDFAFMLVGGIFIPGMLPVSVAGFIIKSIPDLMILCTVTSSYKKTNLLWWFIPSQVIYPFYVITVSVYSLFRKNRW
ncbi:MAG: glycosyltransferase [Bacteroidales bacterium]|jgi:glycosyltransferase involved in cell wall biosynthesis